MVDVLFHSINFAVLISLIWYLFRRYGLKRIKHDLTAERLLYVSWEQQLVEIEKLAQERVQEQAFYQNWYDELQKKMGQWRNVLEHEEQRQQEVKRIAEERSAQRLCEQEEYKELMRMKAQILPSAVAGARQELERYFADTRHQQEYMTTVMKRMRENV